MLLQIVITVLAVAIYEVESYCSPIAFHASKTTAETVNGTIKFDNAAVNEGAGYGNVYSTSTGEFTAPVSGLYLFTWTIVTGEKNAVGTELVVNSVSKGKNFADTRDATGVMDDSGTMTVIVNMNSGDKASIQVLSKWNKVVDGSHWSSFSGYKL